MAWGWGMGRGFFFLSLSFLLKTNHVYFQRWTRVGGKHPKGLLLSLRGRSPRGCRRRFLARRADATSRPRCGGADDGAEPGRGRGARTCPAGAGRRAATPAPGRRARPGRPPPRARPAASCGWTKVRVTEPLEPHRDV